MSLTDFGFTQRQREFLLTVMVHFGCFLERQYRHGWDGTAFQQHTIVPVRRPQANALFVAGDVAVVQKPHFRNPETGKLLFAVAATENAIAERKVLRAVHRRQYRCSGMDSHRDAPLGIG
jgi:hypothetical protein